MLTIEPLYDSAWVAVLLTSIVAAMLFLVRPAGVTNGRRRSLLTLRGFAAVAMALTLFRPAWVRQDNRPSAAALAIAVDVSQSMTLPSAASDGGDIRSRWDVTLETLLKLSQEIEDLDDELQIRLITYDSDSSELSTGVAGEFPQMLRESEAMVPAGRGSDVAVAIKDAIETSTSAPLTGLVLIGDGTQVIDTGKGPGDSDSPIELARVLNATGVPLWSLGVGPDSLTSAQRNVAITGLPESYQMFSGNESLVAFEVVAEGVQGRALQVELVWIDDAGKESVAATRGWASTGSTAQAPIEVPLLAPPPGEYRLLCKVKPVEGEVIQSDNQQVAFVTVREGGGRVLYVEGTPRLEQTYLRRALKAISRLGTHLSLDPSRHCGAVAD